jgi:hypothetical protein
MRSLLGHRKLQGKVDTGTYGVGRRQPGAGVETDLD